MKLIQIGVWVWGTVTTVLAFSCLMVVFLAGLYLDPKGEFSAVPPWPIFGIYQALKNAGSLVAGILGFSGLAWAHFFAVNNRIFRSKPG
jgi:hypothetical protein